jgi:hypothetical protein
MVLVLPVDDKTIDLIFNLVESQPTMTQAILAVGLPAAGVKNAQFEIRAFEGKSATCRLPWA